MGRYLLEGTEARLPYEVEELNLRLYTVEELCYYIYNNLSLIGEDFIDERLLTFLRRELKQEEIADKIERFYVSPSDQDGTLLMLLSEVGYYSEAELKEFQNRLAVRKKKNGPERLFLKAECLYEKKRFVKAIYYYRRIALDREDGRISAELRSEAFEGMANAYGKLSCFERAAEALKAAYDENRQERLLQKLYDVLALSGANLPEQYFSPVPSALLSKWEQEFQSRVTVSRMKAEEAEILRVFFADENEAKKKLIEYVEAEKEIFRSMVE